MAQYMAHQADLYPGPKEIQLTLASLTDQPIGSEVGLSPKPTLTPAQKLNLEISLQRENHPILYT